MGIFVRICLDRCPKGVQGRCELVPYLHFAFDRANQFDPVFSGLERHVLLHLYNGICCRPDIGFQGTGCCRSRIVHEAFYLYLLVLIIRVCLQVADRDGILSCQGYFSDYPVPHDLCLVGIGMRHIASRNIISFPVIDADRDFMSAGSQLFRQVVQVRSDQAFLHAFDLFPVHPYGCLPDDAFQFELDRFAFPAGRYVDFFAVPGGADVTVFAGQVEDLRLLDGRF